jgi:hypothetical protein
LGAIAFFGASLAFAAFWKLSVDGPMMLTRIEGDMKREGNYRRWRKVGLCVRDVEHRRVGHVRD